MKNRPPPEPRPAIYKQFAIITTGRTASHWIAQALTTHSKIYCRHHGRWTLNRHFGLPSNLSVEKYYDYLLSCANDRLVYGDAHGIRVKDLPVLKKKFGHHFNHVFVTRHPITRMTSLKHMYPTNWIQRGMGMINDVSSGYSWPALVHQGGNKYLVGGAPIYKMEELTTDFEVFKSLMADISDGSNQVFPLSSGLENVMKENFSIANQSWAGVISSFRPGRDRGRGHKAITPALATSALPDSGSNVLPAANLSEPERDFATWPQDAKQRFKRGLSTKARNAYEILGYDLSNFLK